MIAIFRPAKNAYDLAVDNGFEGTVEEWLASLQGPPGTAELPTDVARMELDDDQTNVVLKLLNGVPFAQTVYIPPA